MNKWRDDRADYELDQLERGGYDPPEEPQHRTARCMNDDCGFYNMKLAPNADQDVCLACLEPLVEEWT